MEGGSELNKGRMGAGSREPRGAQSCSCPLRLQRGQLKYSCSLSSSLSLEMDLLFPNQVLWETELAVN